MITTDFFREPPDPYGRDRLRRIAEDLGTAYDQHGFVPWELILEHILGTLDQIKMRVISLAAVLSDPTSDHHDSAISLIRQMGRHDIFYIVDGEEYVATDQGLSLCFANLIIYTFLE